MVIRTDEAFKINDFHLTMTNRTSKYVHYLTYHFCTFFFIFHSIFLFLLIISYFVSLFVHFLYYRFCTFFFIGHTIFPFLQINTSFEPYSVKWPVCRITLLFYTYAFFIFFQCLFLRF